MMNLAQALAALQAGKMLRSPLGTILELQTATVPMLRRDALELPFHQDPRWHFEKYLIVVEAKRTTGSPGAPYALSDAEMEGEWSELTPEETAEVAAQRKRWKESLLAGKKP